MASHTLLALALLALSAPLRTSAASCNKHEFHCVTDTVYQFCLDGSNTTNTEALVCPGATKCSSDCSEPCLAKTPCVRCEGSTPKFHCVDDHTFKTCTGFEVPDPEETKCPANFTCSKYCKVPCSPKACPPVTCTGTEYKANPDNPKNYYLCQKINNEDVVIEFACPGKSLFVEQDQMCKEEPTTPAPVTTKKPFFCPGIGWYADPDDSASYFSCTADSAGGITSTPFQCPAGSVFSNATRKCTARTPTTANTPMTFQCQTQGRFPDSSCTGFFLCSATSTPGTFVSSHHPCPTNSFFNPVSSKCTATRPQGCPTTFREYALPETDFECTESGRHADSESALHYYLCSPSSDDDYDGELQMEVNRFSCPPATCFNPETKKCTFDQDVCMGFTA